MLIQHEVRQDVYRNQNFPQHSSVSVKKNTTQTANVAGLANMLSITIREEGRGQLNGCSH